MRNSNEDLNLLDLTIILVELLGEQILKDDRGHKTVVKRIFELHALV